VAPGILASSYTEEGATLNVPKLEKSGYIDVWEGATLNVPKLNI
jgi:hypothetical protein